MPIVVSRSTGEVVSKPQYSQADYDRAWEAVAKLLQSGILSCCFRTRPPRRETATDNQSRQNHFELLPEYNRLSCAGKPQPESDNRL